MAWLIVLGALLIVDATLWWWKGGEWTLSINLWRGMKTPIISAIFGVLVGHVVSFLPSPLLARRGNQMVIGGFLALSLAGSFYPTREITRKDRFAIFLVGFIIGLLFWPR